MRIRNVNLKDETIFEIGKFTVLWSNFEKEKCDNDCSLPKLRNMGDVISKISLDTLNRFALTLQKRGEKLTTGNVGKYVAEGFHPDGTRTPLDSDAQESLREFITSGGQESHIGALFAIYRIRNNMLHGLKELVELDGQIELFKAVNNVLEGIE